MNTKDSNPKDSIGSTKPPLSTISGLVLFEIGSAMLEGACKYRRHNYRIAGVRTSIYYDAAMRHLVRFWEGEDIDPDSGIPHITKAIASLIVLRDSQMVGNVVDDRPPPSDPTWFKAAEQRTKDLLARFPNPLPPYTKNDTQ